MLACLSAFLDVSPGELVGALGSIVGGFIGAAGAGFSVYLALTIQRRDERKRISSAVRREVYEFTRAAVGCLETCENIRTRQVNLLAAHFPFAMRMPKPTIYPAIADRIGRLRAPHRIVAFFTRIAEIETMAAILASQTERPSPFLTPEDVSLFIEAWTDVLQFGSWIVAEKEAEPDIDTASQAHLLRSVKEALEKSAPPGRPEGAGITPQG